MFGEIGQNMLYSCAKYMCFCHFCVFFTQKKAVSESNFDLKKKLSSFRGKHPK